MNCIKCGKQIPEGELFCMECSLNPLDLTFDEPRQSAPRYPAPKGRMQTPQPVKRPAPQPVGPQRPAAKGGKGSKTGKKSGGNGGLKAALAIVSVLLAASLGFLAWQYGNIVVEKNRLRVQAADMEVRSREVLELNEEVKELATQLENAQQIIAARELSLKELEDALSGSESTMSQTQYDMATQKVELERLKTEHTELLLQVEDLERKLEEATAALEVAMDYEVKANFMDDYVVFVENDRSGVYHTYDCEQFAKNSFWAYSRKLAESNGYTPCPVCGGRP